MSTSSVSSSTSTATNANQFSTGSTLQSLGTGSPLQVTGLASGLDTNAIVTALMQANTQRVTNLTNQQTGLAAKNTQLGTIQTALQSVASDAMAMFDPSLYAKTQTVSSTNSTLVGATAINKNGAVQGGYQVGVTQLATSAQRTFTYTPPTADDTVTIDNQQVPVAANASIQTFVSAINNNNNLDVWATATDSGTVVLSARATGHQAGSYIQVSESNATPSLTEQASLAQAGQNAQYTVNGVSGSSASNTVTSAIPGVSLSLNGLTTSSGTVTVDVSSPAANTGNITNAVQQFIKDYNSAITQVQTQLAQKPSSSDPTQGTLYGDSELNDLLAQMRTAMYTTGSGLPQGMATMLDIGVSTGASTGSGPSQNTLSGQLTLDPTALASAIQNNPTGVEALVGKWANSFSTIVNTAAGGGGTLALRIQDDSHQSSNLATQITNLQAANTQKQNALVQEFAKMEAALSDSQSTSTWLTSQINALPTIK
jgi:flagellar hook-associated protein 2